MIMRSACVSAVAALAAISALPIAAQDASAPTILQWFESTYETQIDRTADAFIAGYGTVWLPPPGRADLSDFSVGYDVYDRFDLGRPGRRTLYGTETGIRTLADTLHRAGMSMHIDLILNHNGFSDASTPGFLESGGYPGFVLQNPDYAGDPDGNVSNDPFGVPNTDGDFNSGFDYGDLRGRLAGLVDINHNTNWRFIRHPVDGSDPRNIPRGITPDFAGRLANTPDPNNRRFYPDRDAQPIFVFDPATGEQNIAIYPFTDRPMDGDPIEENATGLLMRYSQYMVQSVGVDGFRIDAAKHFEGFTLDFFDRAIYRSNPRLRLDGSTNHVFSYSEVFDGNREFLSTFIRDDINPNDPGRVGGNRDVLDFNQHFALKANLTDNGFANSWFDVQASGMDVFDDGLRNGSAGVSFVASHDDGGPFLSNVAHAYTLMQPGNAVVYFNALQHGDNRDFPKDGRGDALGGRFGDTITELVNIRNTHGRGDFRERWINEDYLAFERSGSAVVMLSNRNDGGVSDSQRIGVDLPFGTHLIELTGNHANDALIPEVVTVTNDFFEGPSYINARFLNNANQDHGYLIYGLPTPQGRVTLSNVSQVLEGGDGEGDNTSNGAERIADLQVISSDSFDITLDTDAVRLLGLESLRDRNADGDNALFKLDGGVDANRNGGVDFVTPDSPQYGFERFLDVHDPGYFNADGDGTFRQGIDATTLAEGVHYLTVRAFRHRDDGGPAVFSDFRQAIYIDRLDPTSSIASFDPWGVDAEDLDLIVRSDDLTADNVHVFLNLPDALSEAEVLALVDGGNQAGRHDLDLFKYGFANVVEGNNVVTVVTFEQTGRSNVQRLTGVYRPTGLGAGLGDLNSDGVINAADLADASGAFEQVLYSRNSEFDPAGDINGDGRITNTDLFALGSIVAATDDSRTRQTYRDVLRRRGNINGEFGTDGFDIDALFDKFGQPSTDPATAWFDDLDEDGVIGQGDVDVLVRLLLDTEYGDANLDGSISITDLQILATHFDGVGGWEQGDFNGSGTVSITDLQILAANYSRNGTLLDAQQVVDTFVDAGYEGDLDALRAAVPEPTTLTMLAPLLLVLRRRRSSTSPPAGSRR
jgi:hypothetical protein